jgi:hypothetical protein
MKNAEKSDFVLDRTLRLFVYSLRLRGSLMAIRFTYKGKIWEVDSPGEATTLRDHLETEDQLEEKCLTPEEIEEKRLRETKWSPDRFVTLVQNIGPLQKRLLAALLASPESINVGVVAKRIGLPLIALAGVQSGLAKQVRAIGLEPSELYSVNITWTEGERNRYLTLDEGFRVMAENNDWPPENIRNQLKDIKK